MSFLLICYTALFSLFLFVSAILYNSLPWLIYFSFSLFPYRFAYFFRHLFLCLSLYFFSFLFFFSFLNIFSLFSLFLLPSLLFLCFLLFLYLVLFFCSFLVSTFCSIIPFFLNACFLSFFVFLSLFRYKPLVTHSLTHTSTLVTSEYFQSAILISQYKVPHIHNSSIYFCLPLSSGTLSAVFVYHH